MASPTASIDESLWWDSFALLFDDLENTPLPSDSIPSSLASKLKSNQFWFLDSVSSFKPPNQKSKSALDSPRISLGSHQLQVKPKLKEAAIEASSCLGLDEVQSYILIYRTLEEEHLAIDYNVQEILHLVLLHYYIERQCLLKCARQILMLALYVGNCSDGSEAFQEAALQLVSGGLEKKLTSILQGLLSSGNPVHLEVDLVPLWVEETLTEVNLILDILFLLYYENFSTCTREQWKTLCLLFKGLLSESASMGRFAITIGAENSLYHAKVQLLLILVETLDLENLLLMVHDEVPFREQHSVFSFSDLQDMDSIVSSFDLVETVEAGPLILAWAVFLCLLSSLPEKGDCNPLMEIDHVSYVHQAFGAASLSCIYEILQNDISRESDSPVGGYRSVLRTLISAFIASYEVTHQTEDTTFSLILDILHMIYSGEESLCMQFWDKDSFVDGPIRSLICSLDTEFPLKATQLVRLLSALCEGTWPAECVYNFLNKMVGVTSIFDISNGSFVDDTFEFVETHLPLPVPGINGLLIPSGTHGHVLRVIDGSNYLIRWEYMQSGIYMLLLRLAQEFYLRNNDAVFVILDLICRMLSFNKFLSFALADFDNSSLQAAQKNGSIESYICVDIVKILCKLATNMASDISSIRVISRCIQILSKLLKCYPSRVFGEAMRVNVFDLGANGPSSGTWLSSGGLARMLLLDCEQNEDCCSLTISVLQFTIELVDMGADENVLSGLLLFCLQYIFISHEHWKYKLKHGRWLVTLKVLELMKKCIEFIMGSPKAGSLISDVLLNDSSIHDALFRVICVNSEALERMNASRLFDIKEIEVLQLAICSGLDALSALLHLSKDNHSGLPTLHQAVFSSRTKPIPVVTAVISLMSFYSNSKIQVAAAKVFSMLCVIAEKAQYCNFEGAYLVSDNIQVRILRAVICEIISLESKRVVDLLHATIQMLTTVASHQPALLFSLVSTKDSGEPPYNDTNSVNRKLLKKAPHNRLQLNDDSIIDSFLQYVKRSAEFIESHPHLLLDVLNFLKALWRRAGEYTQILNALKQSEKFWVHLTSFIAPFFKKGSLSSSAGVENLPLAYRYQCQSSVLEIIANEIFLQKKVCQSEIQGKQSSKLSGKMNEILPRAKDAKSFDVSELEGILHGWREESIIEGMIKKLTSCGYSKEVVRQNKFVASLCIVHIMCKFSIGDTGSVSLSLAEKINKIFAKLSEHPAFADLLIQYLGRGYSKGEERKTLILNDLYYLLQGELEGREITPGPFRELSQILLHLDIFQKSECENNINFSHPNDFVYLFDPVHFRKDLGLDLWDHCGWNSSKAIGEGMALHIQEINLLTFLADSKHSALKSLISILTLHEGNIALPRPSLEEQNETSTDSCIDFLCKCLQLTSELLVAFSDASEVILNRLATQAELLLNLVLVLLRQLSGSSKTQQCLPVCLLVLKTSSIGLKMLSDTRPCIIPIRKTILLFLTLLLTSLEFDFPKSHLEKSDSVGSDAMSEISLVSLGLLPVLCKCIETAEFFNPSLAAIDLLLKGFLTSNTWLPILQKHLQLPLVLSKLQQRDSHVSFVMILKFLLTLAHFRGGAEMLQTFNFFSSLTALLNLSMDHSSFAKKQDETGLFLMLDKEENPRIIWGLSMAIVTAMITSLGEDISSVDLVDSATRYFFSEKAYFILCSLSAPEFPRDGQDKKRARSQKSHTSFSALRETEFTLVLVCALAKHQCLWTKAIKDLDSSLREISIHLLAFISRVAQKVSESPNGTVPLLCPPILKEEQEFDSKQSFVLSKHGWFNLSARGSMSKASSSSSTENTTSLSNPRINQPDQNTDFVSQTYFSDIVAIQIYKISFLIMKFLALQAKVAAKRAEEIGFIDLACFPQLPMPDILHGLQDQALTIVTELCQSSKLSGDAENQRLCLLLLQVADLSLYLELCVSQVCGMRPILGRVEDFSKEIKQLLQAAEGHAFLTSPLKSLKQITALVYPGLLQTEGIL